MIAVYTDKEIKSAERERKKLLVLWLVALAVTVAAEITMFVVHFVRVQNYLDRTMQTPLMLVSLFLAIAFCFFSLFFFGIKYRYTKAYCKLYRDMVNGPKSKSSGVVLEICDTITENYSVQFRSVKVECPPIRREQRNVRTLLIEKDHSLPELVPGTKINFIAQSNIILGYEITGSATPCAVKNEN